jgi:FAD/FMN-containing dehydrogenase
MRDQNERGVRNWYRDIECHPGPVEPPRDVSHLAAILKDRDRYSTPVRPAGSRHSVTPCMAARAPGSAERWGTLVDMSQLKGPLKVDEAAGTVTVPAGRTFIDVSRELWEKHGRQLHVITELGTLTMGAAACGATKESSFPGEYGQVGSYVVGMRLVKPNGEICDLTEKDPDFPALRSSYGLFGVATEVTFKIAREELISIEHEELRLEDFERRSRQWLDGNTSVFLYLFPYADRIVAELRRKEGTEGGEKGLLALRLRNFFWREGAPCLARLADLLPRPQPRQLVHDLDDLLLRKFLVWLLKCRVHPVRQIVDFEKGGSRFTFSMWAFPAAQFPGILAKYFAFCREYQARTGIRFNLPDASYRIAQDRSSLLSYSHDSDVWTLDPVSTGTEGRWDEFLREFNDRCSDWGGVPLLNQTPYLTRQQVRKAFGERLDRFEETRRRFDPDDRMLNAYFAELLGVESASRASPAPKGSAVGPGG